MADSEHQLGATRIIIGVILALVLLGIASILFINNRTSEAPAQSTTDTRPNSSQNTPSSGGSVTQDGDATDPTTPSPSGVGNNTLLNPDVPSSQ